MIVAIDGPAGAGKSSVARALATRLGFRFLDSGALYRCSVLAAKQRGTSPAEAAASMRVDLGDRILLDEVDVTDAIRSPEISRETAVEAANPLLRNALLQKQRDLLADGDWVAEGRDIGSVVAPDAEVKIYLTASLDERALRRARELDVDVNDMRRDLETRDHRDLNRSHGPLEQAADALVVDTTGDAIDAVLERLESLVERARRRVALDAS